MRTIGSSSSSSVSSIPTLALATPRSSKKGILKTPKSSSRKSARLSHANASASKIPLLVTAASAASAAATVASSSSSTDLVLKISRQCCFPVAQQKKVPKLSASTTTLMELPDVISGRLLQCHVRVSYVVEIPCDLNPSLEESDKIGVDLANVVNLVAQQAVTDVEFEADAQEDGIRDVVAGRHALSRRRSQQRLQQPEESSFAVAESVDEAVEVEVQQEEIQQPKEAGDEEIQQEEEEEEEEEKKELRLESQQQQPEEKKIKVEEKKEEEEEKNIPIRPAKVTVAKKSFRSRVGTIMTVRDEPANLYVDTMVTASRDNKGVAPAGVFYEYTQGTFCERCGNRDHVDAEMCADRALAVQSNPHLELCKVLCHMAGDDLAKRGCLKAHTKGERDAARSLLKTSRWMWSAETVCYHTCRSKRHPSKLHVQGCCEVGHHWYQCAHNKKPSSAAPRRRRRSISKK